MELEPKQDPAGSRQTSIMEIPSIFTFQAIQGVARDLPPTLSMMVCLSPLTLEELQYCLIGLHVAIQWPGSCFHSA